MSDDIMDGELKFGCTITELYSSKFVICHGNTIWDAVSTALARLDNKVIISGSVKYSVDLHGSVIDKESLALLDSRLTLYDIVCVEPAHTSVLCSIQRPKGDSISAKGDSSVSALRSALAEIRRAWGVDKATNYTVTISGGVLDEEFSDLIHTAIPNHNTILNSELDSACKGETGFLKYDDGKLRYDLIPPEWEEALASVLTHGAAKYEAHNWKKGDKDRFYAALRRHFAAYRKGELIDEDSSMPHLWHIMTNVGFLLTLESNNENN